MPFDPTKPVDASLISAVELRNQLNALKSLCDGLLASKAPMPGVANLTQSISNPPTQAQMIALQNKLNELITALTPA